MNDLAFKVDHFSQLQGGWKILEIDSRIPLAVQKRCPADGNPLRTIVTLIGNNGGQRMRYGACDSCGYAGYIDRPTQEWINAFYLEIWKSSEVTAITNVEIENRRKSRSSWSVADDQFKTNLASIVEKITIDKDRFICEIGSGYGDDLHTLQLLGYHRMIGVENSRRRATIATRAYQIPVLINPFEHPSVQAALARRGPLSFIFSRHVLEHVYDPAKVISRADQLQSEGDYLLTIMPNIQAEAAMTCLFFFPHLHSFSVETLTRLLQQHHYKVVDDSGTTDREICLIAQKTNTPIMGSRKNIHFNKTLKKFITGLSLSKKYWGVSRRLRWEKNFSDAKSSFYFKNFPRFDALYFRALLKFDRWRYQKSLQKIHSCVVSPVQKRFTANRESPIEIQFKGNIKLLYK